MRSLLYIVAVVLVIIWVISFLVYHVTGGLIHILLVIAVISLILGVIRKSWFNAGWQLCSYL